jgi:hypothetical protein
MTDKVRNRQQNVGNASTGYESKQDALRQKPDVARTTKVAKGGKANKGDEGDQTG